MRFQRKGFTMLGKRCVPLIASWAVCVLLQPTAMAVPGPSSVQMREEALVIPTYQPGAPDKNPIFFSGRSYQGAKGPVYPYPLFDKLTDVRKDKSYRAVYLENEYVQFCVLPELGGRIFIGLDKTNQYDFFYRQHVIKPALIGMVGAWISGGVEWNIPHHHRASTFMPVDYRLVGNADGSKTVWLGEIELRHRMKWLVGLTLHPGKSYLEATVKLFNRTPLPHSMLYFSNVAVHANPDYQVIFPPSTEFGTQHGKKEFVHWPIGRETYGGLDRRGVDLSWWKNHPTPVSIFAWNYEDDFFGGYDHGKQAGVVHVADHHTVPGKKFFEFSNSEEGRMWDKVLTDQDGPYLELMAGSYSDNQPDYSWVQPYEVKVVKQYWYPIRQLGGIKNANLQAAVNLEVISAGAANKNSPLPRAGEGQGVRARVAVNTPERRRGQVRLEAGGKLLFAEDVEISPERPYVKEVPLPAGVKAGDLKVAFISEEGRELIAYRPAPPKGGPMPKPVEPPPPPKEIKTNEELYLAGLRLEQFHSPALEPYPYYEEALRRDPGDSRVNVALAILSCKRGMYAEAEKHLNAAIERITRNYTSPKDGEAFYYLGVALKAQGKYDAADIAFHKAAWSQAWYGPSHFALAENACRKGDFERALKFVDRAVSANALNTKALCLKSTLLRKLHRPHEALALAEKAQGIDPLDYRSGHEAYVTLRDSAAKPPAKKTEPASPADTEFAVRIKKQRRIVAELELVEIMRHSASSYLELAADYGDCGLWDEAIDVLSRYIAAADDKARVHPLVHYHLGYYLEQKGVGQKANEHYRLGAETPPDYCFPFQWESAEVLQHAMKQNPKDAKAPYYLGNLLFDLQPKKAIEAWERSRALRGSFATVHRNLGLAYAQVENDLPKAMASLQKAVACDPRDPRLFAELDAVSEAAGVAPEKRLALLEQNHQIVAERDDALLREIVLHILVGKCDRAIKLLDHHFHLWEGQTGVHEVYVDAHLLRGQQRFKAGRYAEALKDYAACLEYPDRFETGRARRDGGKTAEIQYLLGTAYDALRDAAKARQHFEQATRSRAGWSDARYYQALAYRELGQEAQATEILYGLVRAGREQLAAPAKVDFFAKFGFQQSDRARKAQGHFLIGLGLLGKGEPMAAIGEFQLAVELDASHLGARTMLRRLGWEARGGKLERIPAGPARPGNSEPRFHGGIIKEE
jgi:tetratricopeptide (TPR) repeat protein